MQTLFHSPKDILILPPTDEDETFRGQSKSLKAGSMKRTEFSCLAGLLAPQDDWFVARPQTVKPPYHQGQSETRRTSAVFMRGADHFMKTVPCQAGGRQGLIDGVKTQAPGRRWRPLRRAVLSVKRDRLAFDCGDMLAQGG